MTAPDPAERIAELVARQVGRAPRSPWRVTAWCRHGFPTVIASPSMLDDGTPFPTTYWLTCPYLITAASEAESSGSLADWDARIDSDPALAEALSATDRELGDRRAAESGGHDACAGTGVAGQAAPSAAKCLHARVALSLVGVHDPIGEALLGTIVTDCDDRRCSEL